MSVLVFIDSVGDGLWPSASSVDRFVENSFINDRANGHRPTAVFSYREPETFLVEAVARAFALSARKDHEVRVVLIGVRDPQIAKRLYQERGLPVNVVFDTLEVDGRWFDTLGPFPGITMSGWKGRRSAVGDDENDDDVVSVTVDAFNTLSNDYRSYVIGLRDLPSFPKLHDPLSTADNVSVYATVMDAFGEGVQSVEPILDAMLEQLCGAAELDDNDDDSDGRWMSTIVEYGDKAAENASHLLNQGQCTTVAAVDFMRRTDRVATSFASFFWHTKDGRPTTADRVLSKCLIQNLQINAKSTELGDLSIEQFSMCLNAKFIASRRWDQLSADGPNVPKVKLFYPEIEELCERITGVHYLLDLMDAGDDYDGDRVFGSNHVEHMEPHVMSQRLVEYASRYYHYRVQYFKLTDTLVFKFTNGVSGDLSEKHYKHRFAGPKDFREFHFQLFKTAEVLRRENGNGDSNHQRLLTDDYLNTFVYRDFGYSDMDDDTVHYVSANSKDTVVRVESYRLNRTSQISGDDFGLKYERRNRIKVKFGECWLAVHGVGTPTVELTVGLDDGDVIAVTMRKTDGRSLHNEGFDVIIRRSDGSFRVFDGDVRLTWPDSRPLLVCGQYTAEIMTADSTKTIVDFVNSTCEVYVSDGAKLRVRSCGASGVEFCGPRAAAVTITKDDGRTSVNRQHCKYLVCRRDMSGYEFVEDGRSSALPSHTIATRTLTRSRFDGQTSALINELLTDYLKTVEKLANRLNAEFSDVTESGLEENSDINEDNYSVMGDFVSNTI